jgi:choline dehydrogenase-like flavoprotein
MHLYMPWWLDNRTLDFPRGYHIEIGGGRRMPSAGFLSNIHRFTGVDASGQRIAPAGYGKALKDDYRRFYGARVSFAGRGEMIPNAQSYCEIDPSVVDRWGIPVLRFHFKWTDDEINQVRHMQQTFRALIDQMGGTPLTPMPSRAAGYGIEPGGRIIHEVGVTRMGHSPSTSVLNAHCQAHDVKNLFVADGGPFVTNADKNVTWTILALAMRTSNYIVEQRKAGTL